MRTPLLKLFRESPFTGLLEHAQKVQEGGVKFREAIKCYMDGECDLFEKLHKEVAEIESEADSIKRNTRGHMPRGLLMPVDKFQFIWYLREQDQVMDSVEDALHWLSYRTTLIPEPMVPDFMLMVDKAVDVIDQIPAMVGQATTYFQSYSDRDREVVKDTVASLRQMEHESDQIERKLKSDIFSYSVTDAVTIFHLIRLVEYLGEISNHAENAGDMLRVMIAK
jgi:predicted phosphate transport protein (TIGR00153 family)